VDVRGGAGRSLSAGLDWGKRGITFKMVQLHADAQDLTLGLPAVAEEQERAARRSLRGQIVRLERELSDLVISSFPHGGLATSTTPEAGGPRLLGLGELERIRDGLAARVSEARVALEARGAAQERNRQLLERMLLEPGRYKFVRIRNEDLGEPGCGIWQVRPRLGLIGMLMGWWQVKLSSGCPLAA
jgi:hypothetical protein